MHILKGYTKQEISWMMYDWANSAHSVIVVTILPIFYNTVAEYTGDAVSSMSTWGYATSAAMAIVALLADGWSFGTLWQSIRWPAVALAAFLAIVTNLKQTKKWHPIVFLGFSAVVGIVFHFAGV